MNTCRRGPWMSILLLGFLRVFIFSRGLFVLLSPSGERGNTWEVRRHFVPTTNCPTGIFWATNCPRWQNVPLSPHATNCPSDKMSHFLPGDKMSHWWSYWKTIVSLAFFRRQIVPRWQNVPLSPRRQNVPTYALMHMKVMESCWDILSPVKKAIGTICRKWKRPVLGIFRGIFFCQETLQHYCLLKEYKRKTSGAICRHWKRK